MIERWHFILSSRKDVRKRKSRILYYHKYLYVYSAGTYLKTARVILAAIQKIAKFNLIFTVNKNPHIGILSQLRIFD